MKKYIILGDFNDAPRSKPLRRFLKKGEQTLAVMLEPIDSRGEKWTHYWEAEGSYSRIDYILISPSLASRVEPSSVRIIDIPESKIGSDHRMVAARVDWKESVNQ